MKNSRDAEFDPCHRNAAFSGTFISRGLSHPESSPPPELHSGSCAGRSHQSQRKEHKQHAPFFWRLSREKTLAGWILLCVLSIALPSLSQTAATSLRGTVKDPSGALVPGAKITLTDRTNGTAFSAVADSAGNYAFPQLRPAKYTITVTATGFGDQSKVAELLVDQPATINFNLAIQSSNETVDVSATAQTLNTTDATIGNSVGNEMIEAMPLDGRDPISLLSLQPGVLFLGEKISMMDKTDPQDQDSRQGAVSGSRSDQGNVTLDGIDNNDEVAGYAFNGVLRSTLDSTEEFRVTTSNANADAGRSSGAQVSLVTKSGTNKLHGSLYEYHRPSNTVANDWFVKNEQAADGSPNRPTKYIVNTFGGSVGGPFVKDKALFPFTTMKASVWPPIQPSPQLLRQQHFSMENSAISQPMARLSRSRAIRSRLLMRTAPNAPMVRALIRRSLTTSLLSPPPQFSAAETDTITVPTTSVHPHRRGSIPTSSNSITT